MNTGKVKKVAEKAVRGAGAGVDVAQARIQKAVLANKVSKSLQNCVKKLESSSKTESPVYIRDHIERLKAQLKELVRIIRTDPYNCEEAINAEYEDLKKALENLLEHNASNEEELEMTIMYKHYTDALRACQHALSVIREERNAAEEKEAAESAPMIVELKGSNIRLLVPDGYEKAKYKNPVKEIRNALASDEIVFRKVTIRSDDILVFSKTTEENAMPFDNKEAVIDGIHEALGDNQGLIEVNAGKTRRGYDYIYSIVKTIRDDFKGAVYYLRMNVKNGDAIIEVNASFDEQGVTGERDSFGFALAQDKGLVETTDDKLIGWGEDPYDPTYDKGILMNLSERPGLDALFPDHPLSQARDFVLAATEDKFFVTKDEVEEDTGAGKDEGTDADNQYEGNEEQAFIDLFAKEPVLRRYTKDIEV